MRRRTPRATDNYRKERQHTTGRATISIQSIHIFHTDLLIGKSDFKDAEKWQDGKIMLVDDDSGCLCCC